MSLSLADLIRNPELLKSKPVVCRKCKNILDALELQEPNNKGWCSDCYFEALGEEVERNPITHER